MKKIIALAAGMLVLGTVAARSQSEKDIAAYKKNQSTFDGSVSVKGGGSEVHAPARGSSPKAALKVSAPAPRRIDPAKLPPRVTQDTQAPHSDNTPVGPHKWIGALLIGVILGVALVRREVVIQTQTVTQDCGGGGGGGE